MACKSPKQIGGGEFTTSENENLDDVTANAPTNNEYWTDAGNYATSFAGGSGTSSDPYLIETPQQLARLSEYYSDNYLTDYFLLTSNLDMSNYWWTPIGYYNYEFQGFFDGGGHTISGLYTKYDIQYAGLFGYIRNSTIHDLTISNSAIDGYLYVGSITGRAYNSNIYNCSNTTNISVSSSEYMYHYSYTGGIVGSCNNTIINNCYNTGIITADYEYVGGIAGYASNSSQINNCYNEGNISSTSTVNGMYVGGIAGYAASSLTITNCYNTGSVTGSSYVGGIAGYAYSSTITNCYNTGSVTGSRYYVGGIAGYAYSSSTITNCYNTGSVTGFSQVGGIVGVALEGVTITNCYNTGSVTGSSSWVGGIVGDASQGISITNCYNTGSVMGDNSGNNRVGGIVGHALDSTSITNCYNTGSVTGSGFVGGIAGYTSSSTITNCYWGGNCTLSVAVGSGSATNCGTCTIEEVKSLSWYSDSSKWNSSYPWDFENTWSIVEGMNDGYPILIPILEITEFTITYYPNGASGSEVVESKVGSESYTIRSNMFSRSGYNFTGWNTQANGGGTSYSAGSSYSELANLDLYAQWSRITYTIKYDKNASDATGSMANTTKYYGTNVTLRNNAFKRTGYSFAGWATEKNGDMVYSNGATYKANANVTLYAKWTAHKYTVKFNGNGSTSGSMSNQTFRYGTAQKLTSNAFKKTGFTFSKWTRNADGTGTSYKNGQSVKNLTSTNGAEIKLYAQWKANNEAKYDSAGDYWYIENGKIPQTKVTNSTLISNLNKATTNGANYYIAGQTLTAKVYSGKEYCKWNNNWYEVEPIKWRLDASSSQKDGYGTTTDTNAVLAEIVYVDQYSSTSIDAGEGYSSQSVTDFMRNGISTTYLVNYSSSTQTFGTGTSLYGSNASVTARMFVSSQSEINAVNGTMNITFSDLVKDIIKSYGGTNVYFTRDLGSNYNNITCINAVGKETQCFATNFRGLQFTVRFTEYGCVN